MSTGSAVSRRTAGGDDGGSLTVVEQVNRHLARDPALVDVLARGLVSQRRTARWLISENGWDATEDAVVSAMRRYKTDHPHAGFFSARDLLEDALVDVLSGLALVTVPGSHGLHERLPGAWEVTSGRDMVGVLPARTQTQLLVEKRRLPQLREALGPHRIQEVIAPVSGLRLRLPEDRDAPTAGAFVLSVLKNHGLRVLGIVSVCQECLLVVPYEEITQAYEVVSALGPL